MYLKLGVGSCHGFHAVSLPESDLIANNTWQTETQVLRLQYQKGIGVMARYGKKPSWIGTTKPPKTIHFCNANHSKSLSHQQLASRSIRRTAPGMRGKWRDLWNAGAKNVLSMLSCYLCGKKFLPDSGAVCFAQDWICYISAGIPLS